MDPETRKRLPDGDLSLTYFPQIISNELFYAVQAKIKSKSHTAGKTGKLSNLFGGIAKCAYCGAPMQIVDKGKPPKGTKYIACDTARRGISCNYCSFNYFEFETAFLSYFKEVDARAVLKLENCHERTKLEELQLFHSSQNGELLSLCNSIDTLDKLLTVETDSVAAKYLLDKITVMLRSKQNLEMSTLETQREINIISISMDDIDSKIDNILQATKSFNESSNEDDRIHFRHKLRNEIRQLVSKILVYPRGRIYSDDDIEKVMLKYSAESQGLSEHDSHAHLAMRDIEIRDMKSTQNNTKADRFFTIYFKNNNYRSIKYSPTSKSYHVSADRIGDRLEWAMGGKQMKPIVRDNFDDQISAEIEHYKKIHPEDVMTEQDIEAMRTHLSSINDYA